MASIGDLFSGLGSGVQTLFGDINQDTPVLGGAEQFFQNIPRENALSGVLDVVSRPNYAMASAADEATKETQAGQSLDFGRILGAAGAGFTGQSDKRFSDVLADAGLDTGPTINLGPLSFNMRDVSGAALDIATDPTTYLSFGGKSAAEEALKGGLQIAKASEFGATTLKVPGVKAMTLLPFDPFTAIAHAADAATSLAPGGSAIKDAVRNGIGQMFESRWGLKKAGFGDLAAGFADLERSKAVITDQAIDKYMRVFEPLSAPQRETFFHAMDNGLNAAESAQALAKRNGVDVAELGDGEAVNTLLSVIRNEDQPWLRAIKEGMGLESFQENYIRHVFPDVLKDPTIGKPFSQRMPGAFKERTGAAGFSTDPVLALAFDQADTLIRKQTNDFIDNTLLQFGAKLKPEDVLPEGFAEYFPKGKLGFYPGEVQPGAALEKALREKAPNLKQAIEAGGLDAENMMAKADIQTLVKQFDPDTFDAFRDALNSLPATEFIGVKQNPRWALPEPIAQSLNQMGNSKEQLGVTRLYDTLQGLWKGSVTTIFPGFHFRNALSNVDQNWRAGVRDATAYIDAARIQHADSAGMKAAYALAGPAAVPDEMAKYAVSQGGKLVANGVDPAAMPLSDFLTTLKTKRVLGGGYYGEDIPSLLADQAAGAPLFGKEGKLNLFFHARQAGQGIEENAKMAHVLGQMRNGMGLDDAITSAQKYLFDYSDLSDFEKNVARRVVPFYTWSRKNIPLMLESLYSKPGQFSEYDKIAHMVGTDAGLSDDEKAGMSRYMGDRFGVAIGRDAEGKPKVLSGLGLPIEDLNTLFTQTPVKTLDGLVQRMAPILKMPLELLFDSSSFTGRHITDPSYQNSYRSAYPIIGAVPGLRDWLEFKETKTTTKDGEKTYYNVDPTKMYIFTGVLGRMYQTLGKAADPNKDWVDRSANDITGVKISSLDLASQTRPDYGTQQTRYLDERNDKLNTAAMGVLNAQGPSNQAMAMQDYRKNRGTVMDEARIQLQTLEQQQVNDRVKPGMTPEQIASIQKTMDPLNRTLAEYYAITPDSVAKDQFGNPDMPAFYKARDNYLADLRAKDPSLADAVQKQQLNYINNLPPAAAKVETAYHNALNSYHDYLGTQPFKIPVAADELDAMHSLNSSYVAAGAPGSMERVKYLVSLPPDQRVLLQRYQSLSAAGPSLERIKFEGQHPELLQWGYIKSEPKAAQAFAATSGATPYEPTPGPSMPPVAPTATATPALPQGMIEQGNIDLDHRPVVKNADGSISTVRSIGVNIDDQEVLIPTVSPDGRILTDDQAIALYEKTGQHLGKFSSAEASDRYAQQLHESQAKQYVGR